MVRSYRKRTRAQVGCVDDGLPSISKNKADRHRDIRRMGKWEEEEKGSSIGLGRDTMSREYWGCTFVSQYSRIQSEPDGSSIYTVSMGTGTPRNTLEAER